MAMNESSLGDDCDPRYEQRYDVGGIYSHDPHQAFLLGQYGRSAAMSYGPLQIMLVNAVGYTPTELNTNLGSAFRASISYLNYQIRKQSPKTVAQIGQLWNGGHVGASNDEVDKYVAKLQSNYEAAAMWLDKG